MRDRRVLRQGAAAEGARRRGGGGLGRRGDHGGRSRRAVRRAAAAAVRCGARSAARAHPGIRLGAQSVRRDGADSGQSGIAERLRRCTAWRCRSTARWWCRRPTATRRRRSASAVYDSLAAKHGKIACIAWQSEWLEGPGVKEAEEAEHVALFRSMPSCFAALAAWHWRAAKRAAGAPAHAADVGRRSSAQAGATDRRGGRPDADRTRGQGGAGAVRRAGGRRARRAERRRGGERRRMRSAIRWC